MSSTISRRGFLGATLAVPVAAKAAEGPITLPGTLPLTVEGEVALNMVEGIDRFLMRETNASVGRRARHWSYDFSSPEAYVRSVAPNRERFRRITGIVDERLSFESPLLDATVAQSALVASSAGYKVYAVRWPTC